MTNRWVAASNDYYNNDLDYNDGEEEEELL